MSVPTDILNELDGPARRAIEWIDQRLDQIEAKPDPVEPYDPTSLIARVEKIESLISADETALYYAFFGKMVGAMQEAGDPEGRAAVYAKLNAALDA